MKGKSVVFGFCCERSASSDDGFLSGKEIERVRVEKAEVWLVRPEQKDG